MEIKSKHLENLYDFDIVIFILVESNNNKFGLIYFIFLVTEKKIALVCGCIEFKKQVLLHR